MTETRGPEIADGNGGEGTNAPTRPGGEAEDVGQDVSGSAPLPPSRPMAQWYPDPTGRSHLRYWNGRAWTDHVWTDRAGSIDPEPVPAVVLPPPGAPFEADPARHRRRRKVVLVATVVGAIALGVAVLAVVNRTVLTDRLLSANFAKGRGPFTTGTSPDYNFALVDGTYRIRSRTGNPDPAQSLANFARTAYDVDMSAEVVSLSQELYVGVGCFTSEETGYVLLAAPGNGVTLGSVDRRTGSNNGLRVIATNQQVAMPSSNFSLQLSCDDSLLGSSVSLKGYINGQQVVDGTDPHGLSGFRLGSLQFAATTAGGEVRFTRADAVVTNSSATTAHRSPAGPPRRRDPRNRRPPPRRRRPRRRRIRLSPARWSRPRPALSSRPRASIRNGPLDAAAFNEFNHATTVAADLHFVAGYDLTYDSQTGSDDIDVTLLDFASNADTNTFQQGFSFSDQSGAGADDAAIPGGYDYNSPNANPDGGFDHAVIATKGSRAMVIDYLNSGAGAVPLVATIAKQQYDRM
jgi:hypothetical protein